MGCSVKSSNSRGSSSISNLSASDSWISRDSWGVSSSILSFKNRGSSSKSWGSSNSRSSSISSNGSISSNRSSSQRSSIKSSDWGTICKLGINSSGCRSSICSSIGAA